MIVFLWFWWCICYRNNIEKLCFTILWGWRVTGYCRYSVLISFLVLAFAWNAKRFVIACAFLFSFFCHPYPGNCKSVFLILKISQYGGFRWWVHNIPRCKNWYQDWYFHFYKTYDHSIWQAGPSTGFDSNKTNQADVGDVFASKSRD